MSKLPDSGEAPGGRNAGQSEPLEELEIVIKGLEIAETAGPEALDRYLESFSTDRSARARREIEAALTARIALAAHAPLEQPGRGGPSTPPRAPAGPPPRIRGFRVDRLLGEGGLGRVFSAWDETLERQVALKTLKEGTPADVRRRILSEARRAAGLHHPSIVTVHSIVDDAETPAVVLELVEGRPIDQALEGLGPRRQARVLEQVVLGLAAAHARGIIHRDLKPANILVSARLEPKILDFGLAVAGKRVDPGSGFEGTPQFASPEQVQLRELTPATDVFSLGVILYKVLTGQLPFQGASVAEVLRRVSEVEMPFPREIRRSVPEDLQAICLACLARDPAQRPPASEVAADLARYAAREPIRLRPALYSDVLRRSVARHLQEVSTWKEQGMIGGVESDRLERVYRRVLEDEDHWIVDARRLSLSQIALYTGAWILVLAPALLVWLARAEVPAFARWGIPLGSTALLVGVGALARRRRETFAAGAFLASAVLSALPATLAVLGECGVLSSATPGVSQLFGASFTNEQILAASGASLALSVVAFRLLRLTGFAWTTCLLATTTYVSFLLVRGWLDRPSETRALQCLPLALLEGAAIACERVGRNRWALPFHGVSLLALVGCLDTMALQGCPLSWTGLGPDVSPYWNDERLAAFSLAGNGLVFLCLMALTERSRSLELRAASRVFEALVPLHLLLPLFHNAREGSAGTRPWLDVGLYVGAVLLVLAISPWRSRRRLLLGGLAGIALGSHLLLTRELVPRIPFLLLLALSGLVLSLLTYARIRRQSRGTAGARGPASGDEPG